MVKVLPTGIAYLCDLEFGELTQSRWHPIALLGAYLTAVEKAVYRNSRIAGGIYAGISLFSVVSTYKFAKYLLENKFSSKSKLFSFALYAFIVNQALASNNLYKVALDIKENLMSNDLKTARENLTALVGRNPNNLDEVDITRAVIESVAENTTDTIISPLFYGTVFSDLAVLIHKLANTMDSMVGYKSDKYLLFGYFAAKCDDWANFVPARIGMLLLIVLNPKDAKAIIAGYLSEGKNHPSMNAGMIESGFATVLNIRLGGDLIYGSSLEHRPILNEVADTPVFEDIDAAINLSKKIASFYLVIVAGIYGIIAFVKRVKR